MKRIKVFCISILVVSLSVLPLSSSATSYTKDYKIMNSPTATKQQIKGWAEKNNASDLYISLIDEAYDMAVKYEIDPTVMLSQFALETGFCRYGGVIDNLTWSHSNLDSKRILQRPADAKEELAGWQKLNHTERKWVSTLWPPKPVLK